MVKEAAYNGKIELSGNGEVTWIELEQVTSAELSFESETEDVTTWDDRGSKNEVPTITGGTLSVEGYSSPTGASFLLLEEFSINKQKLRIKYYRDYKDTGLYTKFNAYVSSISTTQEVNGFVTFSVEMTIEGTSLVTVRAS